MILLGFILRYSIRGAKSFFKEIESQQRDSRHLLLVYDGFAGYLSYKVLNMFRTRWIGMAGLPEYISQVLQLVDVEVFAPLKQAFRTYFSRRTVTA